MVASHIEERAGLLHPLRALQIVAEHVTRDITVVGDGALTYLWLSEVIAEARPEALLFHSHLSSLGCGFGIAVGAQAGVEPGKGVILVAGDGAVGYSLAEFETAVRKGLPLMVVVMNNRNWVAGAFGAGTYYADDAASLRSALAEALSRSEPACINVLVDLDPIPPEELLVMGMDPLAQPSEQTFGAK